ncbi:MAG: PAS domain-containing sensor histidine kinase, partial [Bdellovibrionota bacterium]|nr:PAS domain-containing sensor histidine kinase [Bdellovibrionota bacterium]
MSAAQILLYIFFTKDLSIPYESDILFVITFIFILFIMVFIINSHFNHKQILKDCIKTIEKEKLYVKLTKSEKKFRKLFESKALASCIANQNGVILQISETWSEIFEKSQLGEGSHINNLFEHTTPTIELAQIISNENLQLEKGKNFIPSKLLRSKTNKYFTIYCYYDMELEIIFINCKESTKEYLNSIRLVQQEKFAHLGKSSSGLAHDIFNPLSSLTLNLELSLENIEDTQKKIEAYKSLVNNQNLIETRELVHKSLESAEAIKVIVTRFKMFSRMFSSSSLRNDLHNIIQTAMDLFDLPLSDKVEFKLSGLLKGQYFIKDEKNNFFQVFLNIFQNSYTSYLQKNSATKVIAIRVGVKSETMLTIHIEDFANGMEKAHLKDVFDISFSTKDPEKLGGMGLLLCKDAIESNKGSIEIKSSLKEGTLVTVELPYFKSKHKGLEEEYSA